MTPFQQAQATGLAYARQALGDDPPLAVAPWGWESPRAFLLYLDTPGALPPDPDFTQSLADAVFLVVEKGSGKVDQIGWETAHAIQDDAALVGDASSLGN